MVEIIVPNTLLGILQAMYRVQCLKEDSAATFVDAEPDPEPEAVSDGLYGR